ncbi:MAG: biotin carboxylase N-terminal domain-containing protein [Cyanobacteria bacterium P01_H01_bin.74]
MPIQQKTVFKAPSSADAPEIRPFKSILVANRGEIACRIIQTVRAMGIEAIALASEADRYSKHVTLADAVIFLAGNTATETYLNAEIIIEKALEHQISAIHPGYGFLSENPDFARACQQAGIVFIGPSAEVIAQMGNKVTAKHIMQEAGIPTIPGLLVNENAQSSLQKLFAQNECHDAVKAMGLPVIVKACVGGGGRGMRRVDSLEELDEAIAAAQRESMKAFGSAAVFIEKYIESPRHIEVQVMGDAFGNGMHLFERDCSIQRRHQKIIEESPAPSLPAEVRRQITTTAVQAARAVGYTNAGTVEFILAPDNSFYFLEMNTRLQVEHPVTEAVTGLDLVAIQIAVAAGNPLPMKQAEIVSRGHAIECRICAENPLQAFMPATGGLAVFELPRHPFLRVDTGVQTGDSVSIYYDSMLAKLIVHAESRLKAIETMQQVLAQSAVLGVHNNLAFLRAVLHHSAFIAGQVDTHFIANELTVLLKETARFSEPDPDIDAVPEAVWAIAAHLLASGSDTDLRDRQAFEPTSSAQRLTKQNMTEQNPWHSAAVTNKTPKSVETTQITPFTSALLSQKMSPKKTSSLTVCLDPDSLNTAQASSNAERIRKIQLPNPDLMRCRPVSQTGIAGEMRQESPALDKKPTHLAGYSSNISAANIQATNFAEASVLPFYAHRHPNAVTLWVLGNVYSFSRKSKHSPHHDNHAAQGHSGQAGAADANALQVLAPMPGNLISIAVVEGDVVKCGQALGVIESMKMEITLTADCDATVDRIFYQPGDQVALKALIVQLRN